MLYILTGRRPKMPRSSRPGPERAGAGPTGPQVRNQRPLEPDGHPSGKTLASSTNRCVGDPSTRPSPAGPGRAGPNRAGPCDRRDDPHQTGKAESGAARGSVGRHQRRRTTGWADSEPEPARPTNTTDQGTGIIRVGTRTTCGGSLSHRSVALTSQLCAGRRDSPAHGPRTGRASSHPSLGVAGTCVGRTVITAVARRHTGVVRTSTPVGAQ
jgi:hypothetical protein